ncbi:MAG: hypothetical protein JSV99_07310 [Planctomycetota bacterium]|nr:MAG: hypothetical protein JSV99_07310 [Planctomycetota bacterium]
MAKWAFWTILLYIILVVIIFVPLLHWLAFLGGASFVDSLRLYISWDFWSFFCIFVLIQAGLLLIPVKMADESYQPRRHVWVPIVSTALAFSIILIGIIWSILMAIWGDNAWEMVYPWASLGFVAISWLIWSIVFYRWWRDVEPGGLTKRITTWLISGSILELLVAVPSHIIVRRREDCCAPGLTFLGIATGLVIMALAFGPGLYFLFRERFERMKPRSRRSNALLSSQQQ